MLQASIVVFALDPEAIREALEEEHDRFRPPDVGGLSDVAFAYPENALRQIPDPELRWTYTDALIDLHFLIDEYRFEAVLAFTVLRDYVIKRDRGDAPTLELSGDERMDRVPLPVEAIVVLQRYARAPPNPARVFQDPHQHIAGGRILSRWFAAQLIDSALYRGIAACDRLAIMLRCQAGLPVETTSRGDRRQPSFTPAAMREIASSYQTSDEWSALVPLASNPLFDFIKQHRNGFTHERRSPSELHGERGIAYATEGETSEQVAPAMDAETHYALAPAFYNEVLLRAVDLTRALIVESAREDKSSVRPDDDPRAGLQHIPNRREATPRWGTFVRGLR